MVHCKPSRAKTNMCIILFGETVSQGTFKHIYDVLPIKKFDGGGLQKILCVILN